MFALNKKEKDFQNLYNFNLELLILLFFIFETLCTLDFLFVKQIRLTPIFKNNTMLTGFKC